MGKIKVKKNYSIIYKGKKYNQEEIIEVENIEEFRNKKYAEIIEEDIKKIEETIEETEEDIEKTEETIEETEEDIEKIEEVIEKTEESTEKPSRKTNKKK
ncbi:hypothetical protein [Fusobacterium ulcerans]|uniref:hypothetical protein n=1 Tax=Fusobacterium ulcerans TaxID=861 RepID=UPI0026DAD1C9|nr:hypothetical protein [Fusobacterium ulcerans]